MDSRKIANDEQQCISRCITRYWGDPEMREEAGRRDDPEKRDEEYQACLSGCQVCG